MSVALPTDHDVAGLHATLLRMQQFLYRACIVSFRQPFHSSMPVLLVRDTNAHTQFGPVPSHFIFAARVADTVQPFIFPATTIARGGCCLPCYAAPGSIAL